MNPNTSPDPRTSSMLFCRLHGFKVKHTANALNISGAYVRGREARVAKRGWPVRSRTYFRLFFSIFCPLPLSPLRTYRIRKPRTEGTFHIDFPTTAVHALHNRRMHTRESCVRVCVCVGTASARV